MREHVIVLGGGVAGMSVAHELAERGFRVTVYEKGTIAGGKARSFGVAGTKTGGRRDLPAEHGFRFFPGFYRHLPDTMKRIPYGRNAEGVFDNLVPASEMLIQFNGTAHRVVPARFPRSLSEIQKVLSAAGYLTTASGLTPREIQLYCEKVWRLLTSCDERRAEELEGESWWKYIDADRQSDVYKNYLGRSPRVLVAADPNVANTRTVGDILVQLLFNLSEPGVSADRVLNGPTNEVWIDPWLRHLNSRNVVYHTNTPVVGIQCANRRITGVTVAPGGHERLETADYYVAALPVEKMAPLITPAMLGADPTLAGIMELARHVDWMSGIQFYLTRNFKIVGGHQMFLGSPWALTSLSQGQFWQGRDIARDYGDGTVQTVLSVDISDWHTRKGSNGKFAIDCTREEVATEVWHQLKASLPDLDERYWHPTTPWSLDPAIRVGADGKLINDEKLLVNRPNSWTLRPWARTRIPNLFLAADYVRTHTNLATMEAANEAARRAVNAILDVSDARVEPCRIWDLHEPVWVKPWRWWDLIQYRRGQPWAAEPPAFVGNLARAVLEGAPAIGGDDGYADASAREMAERGVGVVPAEIQQQIADVALNMQTAVEDADLAHIDSVFAADAHIDLGTPGVRNVAHLRTFLADGGEVGVDIRAIRAVLPRGNFVVARFVADVITLNGVPPTQPGQLEIAFVPGIAADGRAKEWVIQSLAYLGPG